jgi:hypothetical protein
MRIRQNVSNVTQNKAGGKAYKLTTKDEFVTNLMTNLYQEPKYYGDNTPELANLTEGLIKTDPNFVARAAVYARQTMNLRTAPIMVLAQLFLAGQGVLARKVIARVATRPDQLKDLVAYLNQFDSKLPKKLHQLRKGIADVLKTFDEYQLGKYNSGNSPTLKDLIRISHVKPEGVEQGLLFKRCLENNLTVPYTWETEISEKGNKAEVWEALIESGKLPYMAMLRNLSNMVKTGVSQKHISMVCAILSDSMKVAKSKQFPFRFYSAYKRLLEADSCTGVGELLTSLSKAIGYSVENISELPGVTFTTADNSGSMQGRLSDKGSVTYADIANVLQAILAKGCKEHIGSVFGTDFSIVHVNPNNDILNNAKIYKRTETGYQTHLYKAIQHLLSNKIKVDRIIILSDMQVYGSHYDTEVQGLYEKYLKEINSDCWLHSIDLAGYGTTPIVSGHTNLMAGWSDKVLGYISAVENGADSMIKDISKIEI